MRIFLPILFLSTLCFGQEPYESNQSYTYDQLQSEYQALVKQHPTKCKLIQFGSSDYGKPIQLFLMNKEGHFQSEHFGDKTVLMINNGIHPGEPCGVDACVKLSKELLADDKNLPENVVIGIIPMYNVGGGHNRTCCSRANQNGPQEYGFRGNAKNLDLNRDFIKADSKNTRTFYKIYKFLKPNIFVDTHTSNGADYKHIMTLITSQTDKMHPYLRDYTKEKLNPHLFSEMKESGYDMVPYVHTVKRTPEDGIFDYLETPRYSTGYTNQFNTIGFVTETHMLKTFEERVIATYEFLKVMIDFMEANSEELRSVKKKADYNSGFMEYIPLNWSLDTNRFELIDFQGYTADYIKSEVTGLDRMKYNHEKPWKEKIKYFNRFTVTDSVKRPSYYVIPQAWQDVLIRLQLSGVELLELSNDMEIEAEVYYIDDYQTRGNPYEGHYLHTDIKVSKAIKTLNFKKGDFAIPTNNENAQFIVQSLEPHAPDGYFAWNFFDAILQQKEWFSGYVFEDTAAEMLKNDPALKAEFEKRKKEDADFASNAFSQLYFLYKRSPNYERSHNQYPVVRFMGEFMNDEVEESGTLFGG